MKRPLLVFAIPVLLISIMGCVFNVDFFYIFVILSIIILLSHFYFKNKLFFLLFLLFSLFSFFLIKSNSQFPPYLQKQAQSKSTAETLITGYVTDCKTGDDYMSLYLKKCTLQNGKTPEKIKGMLIYTKPVEIKIGDYISFTGDPIVFEHRRNEGCFDEKNYYESIGIFSKCSAQDIKIIKESSSPFYKSANFLKKELSNTYKKISPDYYGRLSAIVMGDKSFLEDNVKELYTNTGIGHILAVSGLHISMTGMLIYKILRKMGLSFTACAFTGAVFVTIYVIMTGSHISAIRAAVMFLILLIANVTGRSYDPFSALALQLITTLLINPRSISGPSFLMSYISVLSISVFIYMTNPFIKIISEKHKFLKNILSNALSSFAVFAGLMPLNLIFYNSIPVYSLFLNILIIPFSSILMFTAILAGILGIIFPTLAGFIIIFAERVLDLYDLLGNIFSKLPGALQSPGTPTTFLLIFYYAALALIFILWRINVTGRYRTALSLKCNLITDKSCKKHIIGLMLFCSGLYFIFLFTILHTKSEDFYCAMIDVGQGDCIFVHTSDNKNLLFDGGSTDIKNVYSRRILPFLRSHGINKIDAVFISHSDADHINAVQDMACADIFTSMQIKNIVMPDISDDLKNEAYLKLVKTAQNSGIAVEYMSLGKKLEGENFSLTCLSPKKNSSDFTDINSLSAVYRYEDDDISILFTGDISSKTEELLLKENLIKPVDILKVAHHGSNYSNSKDFISAISPRFAIISCGVNNRYNHPGSETIKRIEDAGIPYRVTQDNGEIIIKKVKGKYRLDTILKENDK